MRRVIVLFVVATAIACAHTSQPDSPRFTLRSAAFREGERMPDNTVLNGLDCHGENIAPAGTVSC